MASRAVIRHARVIHGQLAAQVVFGRFKNDVPSQAYGNGRPEVKSRAILIKHFALITSGRTLNVRWAMFYTRSLDGNVRAN
jgi:hypothetical protein